MDLKQGTFVVIKNVYLEFDKYGICFLLAKNTLSLFTVYKEINVTGRVLK